MRDRKEENRRYREAHPDVVRAAQKKYETKTMKKYAFKLHRVNDIDVIEALDRSENKTDLIRQSIREFEKNR